MDERTVGNILKEILDSVGVSYSGIAVNSVAGQTIFTIETDDARPLIGQHGDTIHALDYLVKKIAEQKSATPAQEGATEAEGDGRFQFLVDVNDYRAKQIKELETKALMMAERARSFQYDV